jgi:uncharacterized membrane protein
MNKKAKKRLLVIHKKLQNLRQQLSGAREQDDEPGEIQQLKDDIVRFEQEAEELKTS